MEYQQCWQEFKTKSPNKFTTVVDVFGYIFSRGVVYSDFPNFIHQIRRYPLTFFYQYIKKMA